jgi:MoaD family protein
LKVRARFYGLVHDELGLREVEYILSDGSTVMDLINLIVSAKPALKEMVYDEEGNIRDYLEIALNQLSLIDLNIDLSDGDLIQIMPPIGGG